MARFVVSVGGSGQHIGLALTRLVLTGALKPDIELIAIDPDVETELPKLLEAPAGMRGDRHPLKARPVFPPFNVTNLGTKNFEALFVDSHHPAETELFEMMFDRDCASIPIHKGMYGTPTVGATVFADGANGAGLQNLLKPLANASEVYVCGSVVGGTGAGVMHKLIGEIRNYYRGALFGIFMLPWFKVTSQAVGGINDATINRNASHGIKYFYEHTIPLLTASALVGYPGGKSTQVLRPLTVGEGRMGENPHYLHLVAARALNVLPAAHTAQRQIKAYGFMHDADNEGWLLDDQWEHKDRTLRQLVRACRWYALCLRYIVNERERLVSHYSSLLAGAAAWGDLHESIKANTPQGQKKGQFASDIVSEFEQMRAEAEFCVTWFDEIYGGQTVLDPTVRQFTTLLESAVQGKSAAVWPEITKRWQNSRLEATASNPNTAAKVSRHHGKVLLEKLIAEA